MSQPTPADAATGNRQKLRHRRPALGPRPRGQPRHLRKSLEQLAIQSEKISQELRAFRCQKAFGMELYAMQRPRPVAYAHDFFLVGPGGDDEVRIVEAGALDDQTVIARGLERIG